MRGFWRDWQDTLGGQVAVETTLDARDRVVISASIEGTGEASGASATMRFGQVWSFRGPKVSRVDGYYDASAALKAAGLPE
jgi:ketosteroid isomerase-like protein